MNKNDAASAGRSRQAKGPQPSFFDDPNTHRLLAIVTALVGEVAVLKERLDTHERLAQQGLVATPEAIEGYDPTEAVEDDRELWRSGFLKRIYRVLDFADEPTTMAQADKAIDEIVDRFSG